MADIHGNPVASMSGPSLDGPGSEFPSADGGVMPAGNVTYSPGTLTYGMAGDDVMAGASGGPLQESAYAHDLSAGAAAPYYGGEISPIFTGGTADAGGRDDVSGTVAGSVAAAEARFNNRQAETLEQGSTIGDLMGLPAAPVSGEAAVGSFYDPPRDY